MCACEIQRKKKFLACRFVILCEEKEKFFRTDHSSFFKKKMFGPMFLPKARTICKIGLSGDCSLAPSRSTVASKVFGCAGLLLFLWHISPEIHFTLN